MPTVHQRRNRDGKKAAVFTADIWINGKKLRRSTDCTTRREAQKAAIEIEKKLRADIARGHQPLTLDTMFARYWEEHAAELPSASSVAYHIRRLLQIIGKDKKLEDLSNKDLTSYVTTRKRMFAVSRAKNPRKNKKPPRLVSAATINRELDVLQAAYTRARDAWEHPVRPIAWGIHRVELPDRKKKTLTFEQAVRAIQLARTKSKDMADAIELSIYTGARQNEVETIIPERVRLDEKRVIVLPKRKARQGYRERDVFLGTAAVALLAERMKPDMDQQKPIFDLKNGRKIWEWVRAEIGRPDVRWHDLRHTHATMLAQASRDPRIVQHQLGHSNISTSMAYISTEDAETIAAVDQIKALTDRKVVALRPDAEAGILPPSQSTLTNEDTEKSA